MTHPSDGLEEGARSTQSSHSGEFGDSANTRMGRTGEPAGRERFVQQRQVILPKPLDKGKVWEAGTGTCLGLVLGCCRVWGRVDEPILRLQARAEGWVCWKTPPWAGESASSPGQQGEEGDLCQCTTP